MDFCSFSAKRDMFMEKLNKNRILCQVTFFRDRYTPATWYFNALSCPMGLRRGLKKQGDFKGEGLRSFSVRCSINPPSFAYGESTAGQVRLRPCCPLLRGTGRAISPCDIVFPKKTTAKVISAKAFIINDKLFGKSGMVQSGAWHFRGDSELEAVFFIG